MDSHNRLIRDNRKFKNNTYSWTCLHFAVVNGDTEAVQTILQSGGYIDAKDKYGQTPLHHAVEKGRMKIIELLISNGAYLDAKDDRNRTPIHIAVAKECSEEMISLLLSSGASVDVKGNDGITPLHIAAKQGNVRNVENLLNNGACINSLTIEKGYIPLHFASEQDNEKVVKLFLDRDVDINAATKSNETSTHIAAKRGCEKVLKLLLQHGAKVDVKDNNGKTILYTAVANTNFTIVQDILKYSPDTNDQINRNSLKIAMISSSKMSNEVFKALLEYGFDIDVKPDDANSPDLLHGAIRSGYLKIVEGLLKFGSDVNAFSKFNHGFTPLHTAAFNKQEEIAKLLINYKADINAQDESENTPLYYAIENDDLNITKLLLTNRANIRDCPYLLNIAVERKCVDIVEALLQHGADVNATDACEQTALHFTADTNEKSDCNIRGQIAKLLLSNGANVDARDNAGLTTLHYASRNGYAKVVEALLEYNADVNCKATYRDASWNQKRGIFYYCDLYGFTPIHGSARKGHEEISRMLLKKGADANACQIDGITALHIAAQKGHKEVAKVLLEGGAKFDSKTALGVTPLHEAAEKGYPEIIETILKYGANIDSTDGLGLTPLHIASFRGHYHVVSTLLEYGADINIACRCINTPLKYAINLMNYDNRFDNNYKETAQTIVLHIVRMKNANLYVSEKNLSIHNPAIKNFWAKCEEEISSMKSEKINNTYISFFDILAKTTHSISIFMRKEDTVQLLKLVDYETKFPIYAGVVRHRLRKGMERKELLQHGNKIFNLLFKSVPALPYECNEKIFRYLSDQDLNILMTTFEHLNIY